MILALGLHLGFKMAQDVAESGPTMVHTDPEMAPRWPQDDANMAPDGPKVAPRWPKVAPRCRQQGSGRPQIRLNTIEQSWANPYFSFWTARWPRYRPPDLQDELQDTELPSYLAT